MPGLQRETLPDFTPRWLWRWLAPLEQALEATPLGRWSVHYFAVLERLPAAEAPAPRKSPRDISRSG